MANLGAVWDGRVYLTVSSAESASDVPGWDRQGRVDTQDSA